MALRPCPSCGTYDEILCSLPAKKGSLWRVLRRYPNRPDQSGKPTYFASEQEAWDFAIANKAYCTGCLSPRCDCGALKRNRLPVFALSCDRCHQPGGSAAKALLSELIANSGPMAVMELADRLQLDRSNIKRHLDELESLGVVRTRLVTPDDNMQNEIAAHYREAVIS